MGSQCDFACRPGYALNTNSSDCELLVLRQSARNTLLFMRISNCVYKNDCHNVTVAHIDTSRFVILVRAHALTGCASCWCCYGGLARVSTDSWSLSHLGYLYPGTTPVMIKLEHNTGSCPWL